MRWSRYFVPTLRDNPADAEVVSHQLLLRAGMVRQLASGVYSFLPLAWRVLLKITQILREEMDGIGGQEFHLPALHPAEVWRESGRWEIMGDNMFHLRDRKGAEMCLGMTHEEVFSSIARKELRSYKQLPQIWYQIQTKFRDEPRPRSGVLRVREFIMKDAYTFDLERSGLDKAFNDQRTAYRRIFDRCGLQYAIVHASSGTMGGSESSEFMVLTDAGEDHIAICSDCGYAANLEKAASKIPSVTDEAGPSAPVKFPTPNVRTIDDLEDFPGGAPARSQIKTLVYFGDGQLMLVLMRGDHELNETKLADTLGISAIRPGHPEEIREALGASPGSLGAVGVEGLRIIADRALESRKNMTTGANEDDFHLRGVDIARDIRVELWADLRSVREGEGCPVCDERLSVRRALEIGHIFKLGTKYSETMGATVLNEEGKEVPIVMGSYGIGVERIMASAIELNHDPDGIVWPMTIAPYQVVVTPVNINQAAQRETAEAIYRDLSAAGIEVLLDDRDERPGVKFKDADLVGIPLRVTIGPKKLASGQVELTSRRARETRDVPRDVVISEVRREISAELERLAPKL
ncbi:MAG: proline--tRNA ligase [Acidobacteria bacterium]|nr:proline--tRNA ligase [Acidobacteriota bacterium]